MAQHEAILSLEGRPRRVPLQLDANAFIRALDNDSANTTPDSSAPSHSPDIPLVNTRPSSRDSGSETLELDEEKASSSGPQRSRSVSSGKSDKEKRKRSRVTPEQLVHLERFFAVDRSPTAARRREISDLLGMQERQTQIWFQNRRAKAKLQDGKHKGRSGSAEVPPDSPPELSTGFEVDLHNLIHEHDPVTIIPCTDLSIGAWRRIATTVGKHDLVAYVCDVKRCLTWFIHSGGFGFKMEIPFETIVDTEFTNAAPGSGLASFILSQPPVFYLEHVSSPRPDSTISRQWRRCSDWTEGHQATHVLRHDLIGSAVQLAHLLRNLHANTAGTDISLRHPTYRTEPVTASPAEFSLPPMAGLTGPGYHYQNDALDTPPQDRHDQTRKRPSFPGSALPHTPDSAFSSDSDRVALNSVPDTGGGSFPLQAYPPAPPRSESTPSSLRAPMYTDYTPESHVVGHHGSSVHDYNGVPISHGLAPRPYSAQPVSRAFYNDAPRLVQPYQTDGVRRSHSSTSLGQHYEDPTPSPPMLTRSYHPPAHPLENMSNGHVENMSSSTHPAMSGLPGMPMYESDEDPRRRRRD